MISTLKEKIALTSWLFGCFILIGVEIGVWLR